MEIPLYIGNLISYFTANYIRKKMQILLFYRRRYRIVNQSNKDSIQSTNRSRAFSLAELINLVQNEDVGQQEKENNSRMIYFQRWFKGSRVQGSKVRVLSELLILRFYFSAPVLFHIKGTYNGFKKNFGGG